MIGEAQYPRGSRVLYAGAWGSFAPVPATVTGYGEKNGRAVVHVDLDNGATHWGYLDQLAPLPPGDRDTCSDCEGEDYRRAQDKANR